MFFAYLGFENIANIAEETKNASRVIPRALLISILVTTVVRILVSISSLDLAGWKQLSLSEAPLATVAGKAFAERGTFMLYVIALFATLNTALIMLVCQYGGVFDFHSLCNSKFVIDMVKISTSQLRRGFSSPIRIGKFPLLAGLGPISSVVMLFQFSVYTVAAGICVIGVSMTFYKIIRMRNAELTLGKQG